MRNRIFFYLRWIAVFIAAIAPRVSFGAGSDANSEDRGGNAGSAITAQQTSATPTASTAGSDDATSEDPSALGRPNALPGSGR